MTIKRKRRVFSMLLALMFLFTMIIGTGAVAYAEGTNTTVQINGATSETSYEGYRLLTATTGADGSVTYALNEKYQDIVLQAASTASGSEVTTLEQLLTFLDSHRDSGNSTATEDAASRKFADEVYTAVKGMSEDFTFHGGDNTISHTDYQGYWLLGQKTGTDTTTSILFALTKSTVIINVKQSTPVVHKKVMEKNDSTGTQSDYIDAADYDIGDSIPYMITGTISDQIKNFSTYTYKFTDTLPAGLTLDAESVVVQIEKVEKNGYAKGINATQKVTLDNGNDYTVSTSSENGGTVLTVDVKTLLSLVNNSSSGVEPGDTVVVTYNATLNENAKIGSEGNVNNVKLTYSHNPYTGEEHDTTTRNAKVYTYALNIFKTGKNGTALTGAGFTISKLIDGEYKEIASLGPDGATYSNGFEGTAVFGAQGDVENSTFLFSGLDAGSYRITESVVPEGYRKAEDIDFTISTSFINQNSSDAALKSLSVTALNDVVMTPVTDSASNEYTGVITTTIHNGSDSEIILPNTGGYGIAILIGGVAVFAYGIFMFVRRKRNDVE